MGYLSRDCAVCAGCPPPSAEAGAEKAEGSGADGWRSRLSLGVEMESPIAALGRRSSAAP